MSMKIFRFCRRSATLALAGWSAAAALPAAETAVEAAAARAAFAGTRAGEARTIGGMALRWCPAGAFRMGSPADEPGRRADETPVDVVLTAGFWIGQFEVTQGQWVRLMGAVPGELSAGRGGEFAVYWVSFVDAENFCRRLTEVARAARELPAGWEFGLPTEAQWEYACRAGTTTPFAFGARLTPELGNFGRPFRGAPAGYPDGSGLPGGKYPANAWGIHDMHGNQWEWCRDWYHAQLPGGTDPDLHAVPGRPNGDRSYSRVRRGGAWPETEAFCRSAARLRFEPERRSNHIGFRVVLVRGRAGGDGAEG
jgi:formylglycine-generating enzyme required for sulfatase activity